MSVVVVAIGMIVVSVLVIASYLLLNSEQAPVGRPGRDF